MAAVPTQPSPDAERVEIVDDLIDALRLFTVESDVFVEVFARAHGLGRNDLNAIMWISQGTHTGQPITSGELAARLGLGAPATTGLVDRLENAGHVRRRRDPQDRRKVTIVMQPQALQLARDFFVPLGRLMHDTVADVSAEDLRRVTAVVRGLISAVTTARTSIGS
ncbi:MarR family winged helix-turn-helix transcriptional regulator [Actinoplanes sp. N902-109]|uniref:MarR family winged helix-turn-helix transcriptional regulator n=1 Tax=Actinoplanes sp. (strain N902-109) TaxID=649831 RepID=UPI00032962D6|nr:MarR family winged helix-turn-helix transcriptional regulator [Actinoplanes sp. N902-109]AGL19144.1 regulatory protein MarR [Actinoplanes sp. N902-109]